MNGTKTTKFYDGWGYELTAELEEGRWFGNWKDLADGETGGSDRPCESANDALIFAGTNAAANNANKIHWGKRTKQA